MNIQGKKVVLRAIEEEDLPLLRKWTNDPEVAQLLGDWNFPVSSQDQKRLLAGLSVDSLHQRFAIENPDIGLIGTANLVDINWKNRNASHSMMIGDTNHRGKGYGRDTIMAIMRYAFEELGLQRLDGSMIEDNEASIATYVDKCNWKVEGRQRNWYFRRNRFWDRVLVGVTKEDYFELLEKENYWGR